MYQRDLTMYSILNHSGYQSYTSFYPELIFWVDEKIHFLFERVKRKLYTF